MNKILQVALLHTGNFFFPRTCYVCGERILTGWSCPECIHTLPAGIRFDATILPPLQRVAAIWRYENAVRAAIDDWKFNQLAPLGEQLIHSALKYEWLQEWFSEPFDVIIGIPPHRHHLRMRGFDPVQQIVRNLSTLWNTPNSNALVRARSVNPQIESTRKQRQHNVLGAFRVNKPVTGSVLLVDDVITTGSTLREAAKTLLGSGADRVSGFILASAGSSIIIQDIESN